LLYSIDAGMRAVRFYHFDRIGSTLFLTDDSGAVSDAYAYDPYGQLLAHSGSSDQPFTFVGRHGVRWESVGSLYHMRARYYDPSTARFLTRDTIWPMLAELRSLNPYAYALQNPLGYIDPLGTQSLGWLDTTAWGWIYFELQFSRETPGKEFEGPLNGLGAVPLPGGPPIGGQVPPAGGPPQPTPPATPQGEPSRPTPPPLSQSEIRRMVEQRISESEARRAALLGGNPESSHPAGGEPEWNATNCDIVNRVPVASGFQLYSVPAQLQALDEQIARDKEWLRTH